MSRSFHAPRPAVLEGHGIRLEPLSREHHDGLVAAASDGRLWELWFTSVPEPEQTHAYISGALAGQQAGSMLPWAVRELASGAIVRARDIKGRHTTLDVSVPQGRIEDILQLAMKPGQTPLNGAISPASKPCT